MKSCQFEPADPCVSCVSCVSLLTGCLFESELCSPYEICVNGKMSLTHTRSFNSNRSFRYVAAAPVGASPVLHQQTQPEELIVERFAAISLPQRCRDRKAGAVNESFLGNKKNQNWFKTSRVGKVWGSAVRWCLNVGARAPPGRTDSVQHGWFVSECSCCGL